MQGSVSMENLRMSLTKKQLRYEMTMLENLIGRYSGDINLWTAHDNVAVALDFYRGTCTRRKKKVNTKFTEKELQSWI